MLMIVFENLFTSIFCLNILNNLKLKHKTITEVVKNGRK